MGEEIMEWKPEFRFDMEQNIQDDDFSSLWGFGFFLTLRWYF